jgi:hypothetical protein
MKKYHYMLLVASIFIVAGCASTSKIETTIPENIDNNARNVLNKLIDSKEWIRAEAIADVQRDKIEAAVPFLINMLEDDSMFDFIVIEETSADEKIIKRVFSYSFHQPGTSELFTIKNVRRASDGVLVQTTILPSTISESAFTALKKITSLDYNKKISIWKKWWMQRKE